MGGKGREGRGGGQGQRHRQNGPLLLHGASPFLEAGGGKAAAAAAAAAAATPVPRRLVQYQTPAPSDETARDRPTCLNNPNTTFPYLPFLTLPYLTLPNPNTQPGCPAAQLPSCPARLAVMTGSSLEMLSCYGLLWWSTSSWPWQPRPPAHLLQAL